MNIECEKLKISSNLQKITNPKWIQGKRIINPQAGDVIHSFQCGYGIKTTIAGYRVATNDPRGNIFTVVWINNGKPVSPAPDVFNVDATVQNQTDFVALNENTPCDAGSIIIIKVEKISTVGTWYQADLCLLEEVM